MALKRGIFTHALDVVLNVVIIVAVVMGVRTFLVAPFQVDGNSMLETLSNGEYIVINKFSYFVGTPQRGDVVVLRPPSEPQKYYVKRVIGLPGDVITLRGGYVYLKAKGTDAEVKLDETGYLTAKNLGHTYHRAPDDGNESPITYTVPDGSYFVLGDNRTNSTDSRAFFVDGEPSPYVPVNSIKGKVWFVALPVTKIHALEAPAY